MTTTTRKVTALEAYVARKAEIDDLLFQIRNLTAIHSHVSPDDVHWGHVGNLTYYAKLLRRIAAQR
jgi:hypothetical protein